MSNENKKQVSTTVGLLLILSMIPVGVLLSSIIVPEILSPYFSICFELAWNVDGLSPAECIQYMEANPGATGQDVVDYEASLTKIDELLNNPLEPSG